MTCTRSQTRRHLYAIHAWHNYVKYYQVRPVSQRLLDAAGPVLGDMRLEAVLGQDPRQDEAHVRVVVDN